MPSRDLCLHPFYGPINSSEQLWRSEAGVRNLLASPASDAQHPRCGMMRVAVWIGGSGRYEGFYLSKPLLLRMLENLVPFLKEARRCNFLLWAIRG